MIKIITLNAFNTNFSLKHFLTAASIFILFFSTGFNATAQAPGYLGKRFLIGIEAPMIGGYDLRKNNFEYMVENSKGSYRLENKDFFPLYFKIKPTINVEFVLNRKTSIQAFGRFFSSKIDITPFYDTVGTENQKFYPIDRAKAKTVSFGLKYKIFTGDGLSPVGKYISFGAEYASNSFEFKDDHFINDHGYEAISREPQSTNSRTLVFTFGFGTQYPVGKNLIFNLGGELGLPLSVFGGLDFLNYWGDPEAIFEDPDTPTSVEWAKLNSKNNFFRSYLFNITVGLSLLP